MIIVGSTLIGLKVQESVGPNPAREVREDFLAELTAEVPLKERS